MDANELRALADRCEKATGPDRELDGLIQRVMGANHPVHYSGVGVCNAFTGSLDAAMTLVPEGYALGFKRAPCQRSHAMLATVEYEANASGATPALALCAAALRARAALAAATPEGE